MEVTIPKGSFFRPIVAKFPGFFNSPAAIAKYNFSLPQNKNVELLPITYQNLFFISILNFSMNISESSFIENDDQTLQLLFQTKQNAQPLFGGPYPFIKFLPENEVGAFFFSNQKDDTLTGTFTGTIDQSASLIGPDQILAVVAMNIFEISDQKWIAEFKNLPPGEISRVVVPRELERRI